jgi:hypothetical protein
VHFGIPRNVILDRDTRFLSAFWSTLCEKLDTKLNISIAFHIKIDGYIVVNRTLVQLLRDYNHKHSKTWDKNLINIKHSYNREVHTSTDNFPFENLFGYFPPSPLDIVYGKKRVKEDITGEALKAYTFVENIR